MKTCAVFLTITLLLIFVEDGLCRGGRGGGSRGGSSGTRTGGAGAFSSSGGSANTKAVGISFGVIIFIGLVILFCAAGGGKLVRCVRVAKCRILDRFQSSQTRVSSLANRNTNNSEPEPLPPPYTVSPLPSYSTEDELRASQSALNTQRAKSETAWASPRENTQPKVNGGKLSVLKPPTKINVKPLTDRGDV